MYGSWPYSSGNNRTCYFFFFAQIINYLNFCVSGRSRQKGGKSILLAFDKIYRKEIVNQCNAEWMEQAVINVSNMSKHEIRQKIEKNQSEILKDAKIAKIDKGDAKISSEYKDFKMVS